ncbi:M23 family metallopeptidase [Streptomyces sp. LBUM 1478]|nr:M23 family metallopeptidase [Streptomyces sp. LBUM 1478]
MVLRQPTGVDFHAATGTAVLAVGSGTVVEAAGRRLRQQHRHPHDRRHVHPVRPLSSIGVSVGQTVTPGQQIGLSGATGNVTARTCTSRPAPRPSTARTWTRLLPARARCERLTPRSTPSKARLTSRAFRVA